MKSKRVEFLLIIVVVLIISVILYRRLLFQSDALAVGSQPDRPKFIDQTTRAGPAVHDDSELMAPDEMLAVRYARGKVDKSAQSSWTRYMHFLWAQMTRPPIPLADLGKVNHQRKLARPNGKHYSQLGQSETVEDLLKGRRDGFFVECGAWDGEEFSNSLFFELHRNWTGLLIENDPEAYEKLLMKNRTVYTYNGCLSPTGRSEMLPFRSEYLYSGVAGYIPNFKVTNGTRLTSLFCVPLNDLLAAIGRNHVDFLSLDIEGAEAEVLKNFDFNAVRIDVMTVEYGTVRLEKIRNAVLSTGLYREARIVSTLDVIFIRKDIN